MRTPTGPAASYVGDNVTPMARTDDEFYSVGDLGWMDEEGFLYMADRRVDMIVTGAANVFPAEVESALSEHPQIADVVVIGLRDPEWGRRVHAIVQPKDLANPPDEADIIAFAKARLASVQGSENRRVRRIPPPQRGHEIEPGSPRAGAGRARAGRRVPRGRHGLSRPHTSEAVIRAWLEGRYSVLLADRGALALDLRVVIGHGRRREGHVNA